MSISVYDGWLGLLASQEARVSKYPQEFSSRDEFIRALETAADEQKEQNIQTNLNRLRISYRKVKDFAIAVENQSGQIRSYRLLVLVWNVSFTVIKLGFSVRLKLETVVDCITDLDKRVPHIDISTEVPLDVPALQEPLQMIYSQYIEYHFAMIDIIEDSKDLKSDILPIFSKAVDLFDRAQKEYSKLREVAKQTALWAGKDKAPPPQFKALGGKPLGHGTYGSVERVEEISTGQQYARKRISTGSGSSQVSSEDWVKNEIKIMRKLSHHHITTLAFCMKDNQGFNLFILPVAECNLRSYLETSPKNTRYSEKQSYRWFGCLVGALDYAHRRLVKHKDIKPANILIHDNGDRILLTDFGLAKEFSDHGVSATTGPLIFGTSKYLAPECTNEGERTEAVDIFALGCVYAEILSFLSGQPLGEFDKKRDGWGGKEFRCCLGKTRRWLMKLKEERNQLEINIVVMQTIAMLETGAIHRSKTAYILERFTGHDLTGHDLRCPSCPR